MAEFTGGARVRHSRSVFPRSPRRPMPSFGRLKGCRQANGGCPRSRSGVVRRFPCSPDPPDSRGSRNGMRPQNPENRRGRPPTGYRSKERFETRSPKGGRFINPSALRPRPPAPAAPGARLPSPDTGAESGTARAPANGHRRPSKALQAATQPPFTQQGPISSEPQCQPCTRSLVRRLPATYAAGLPLRDLRLRTVHSAASS